MIDILLYINKQLFRCVCGGGEGEGMGSYSIEPAFRGESIFGDQNSILYREKCVSLFSILLS